MSSQRHRRTLLLVGFCFCLVVLLAACAPRTGITQPSADDEQATVVAIDWSTQTDCAPCHVLEAASFDDSSCLASKHPDAACVSCHTDETQLIAVHEGKTTADKVPAMLQATLVEQSACVNDSCHLINSYEELAVLTADSTVLTDTRDKTVNPHEMPLSTPSHIEADMQCANCHAIHDPQGYEAAQDYCYSCHHHKVYECGTCHTVT